jgi:DNA-binding NarL/FixJ family response regulator
MPPFAAQKVRASGDGVPARLTKRQRQLLTMLDTGKSNIEMSRELGLSLHTVKVHLWRFYSRIGVNTRIEALRFAHANGWLGFRAK